MEPKQNNTCPKTEDEISLREIILKLKSWFKYLLSKLLTISLAGLIGAASGLTIAILTKPVYKATLSFALEDEKGGGALGGYAGLASQFGFNLGGGGMGGAFSGDNLLEFMKSRMMLQNALLTPINDTDGTKKTLAELYIQSNKLRDGWMKEPHLSSVKFSSELIDKPHSLIQDSLLGVFCKNILKENLVVNKENKKLDIVDVTVSSKNELFSKYFTEILVAKVSEFYIKTKIKKSAQNLAILQHQTDSVRRTLNLAISGVAAAIDFNPNPNLAKQSLRVPSQRRQVDVQANTVILSELVKNLELSKIALRKETPLIQIIDTPTLPLEKNKLSKVLSMIVGGLLGGILAAFFLLIREALVSFS